MQPLKQCTKSGCNNLISFNERYCAKHLDNVSKRYDRARRLTRTDYMKFYNSKAWKQAREQQLMRQPLCQECLSNNLIEEATVVHHIHETKTNWDLRLVESNLESICKSCHEKIPKGRWYP